MSWTEPGRGFDPERHARRLKEKAREQERLQEMRRQEHERAVAKEAARAEHVERSLSQGLSRRPLNEAPEAVPSTRRSSTPQTSSHRLPRTGVGCWGFVGLYLLFSMVFSSGSAALTAVDEGVGAIATLGVPIVAYFIWRHFYRQYRSWLGFLYVAGGLYVLALLLIFILEPLARF